MASLKTTTRKLGDGYTYYEAHSGTEPDVLDLYNNDTTFGGTDPTGSEFAVERELYEDEVSQELGRIATKIMSEKGTFKITISAGAIENLALAVGLDGLLDTAGGDITTWTSAENDLGNFDADVVMVGGKVDLQQLSLLLRVCNSWSPVLHDYLWIPNASAQPSATVKFARNEVRKIETTFDAFPSTRADFLATGNACGDRHGLAKFIYEKA